MTSPGALLAKGLVREKLAYLHAYTRPPARIPRWMASRSMPAGRGVPEWLQDLEKEMGGSVVRVVLEEKQEDFEADEDDLDEIMAEPENPWRTEDAAEGDGEQLVIQPSNLPSGVQQDRIGTGLAFPTVVGSRQLDELRSQIPGLVVLNVHGEEGLQEGAPHDNQGSCYIPIHELTGQKAKDIAAAPGVVVVAGPDHRCMQACLRLSRVYKTQRVFVFSLE
ncbi:hypothetical protein DUNSADRAFT_1107 [Dunaliella salina]|uniref:Uncharacterized protein n=1 Tax=Dunaliella salina TaxID=3046 RepID=A0ABQ7GXK4_DUNSA|nr:hypothetical protein DUNSADRAFT_1107 [Dunaliella salina]|eukprot:KAF5839330.1 hypothetical protein DUNSADRAFT_1107 [Dunaliella salina]